MRSAFAVPARNQVLKAASSQPDAPSTLAAAATALRDLCCGHGGAVVLVCSSQGLPGVASEASKPPLVFVDCVDPVAKERLEDMFAQGDPSVAGGTLGGGVGDWSVSSSGGGAAWPSTGLRSRRSSVAAKSAAGSGDNNGSVHSGRAGAAAGTGGPGGRSEPGETGSVRSSRWTDTDGSVGGGGYAAFNASTARRAETSLCHLRRLAKQGQMSSVRSEEAGAGVNSFLDWRIGAAVLCFMIDYYYYCYYGVSRLFDACAACCCGPCACSSTNRAFSLLASCTTDRPHTAVEGSDPSKLRATSCLLSVPGEEAVFCVIVQSKPECVRNSHTIHPSTVGAFLLSS